MNFRAGAFAILIAVFAWGGLRLVRWNSTPVSADPLPGPDRLASPDATPVLVELFTSEGCSSCPPADALLSRLGKTQPVASANIIALEEHVDYWDDQGWKDPFSSEAATARQREYSQAFGGQEIYTPQMIVDGRTEFVGSSGMDALRVIRSASQAPKPVIHLAWQEPDTLSIQVDPLAGEAPAENAQLFLVIAENMLHSDVRHGENAGRALEHNGVVRQFSPVEKIAAAQEGFSRMVSVHVSAQWNRANLRAVVFVQEQKSRRIVAASSIPFPS
jgi:hypothetical protein